MAHRELRLFKSCSTSGGFSRTLTLPYSALENESHCQQSSQDCHDGQNVDWQCSPPFSEIVARKIWGLETPLAVLPGGTANVLSVTVGIPKPLGQAVELALRALQGEGGYKIKPVDLGQLNGKELFILRLGAGFEAEQDQRATRELKDKVGRLAYSVAGVQTLKELPLAHYRLTLDGEVHEEKGISLMVANTTNTGVPGVYLSPGNDVGDGLLDVVVFEADPLRISVHHLKLQFIPLTRGSEC